MTAATYYMALLRVPTLAVGAGGTVYGTFTWNFKWLAIGAAALYLYFTYFKKGKK